MALRRRGMTVQAIAARLNIPDTTVGTRCNQANAYRPLADAERDFLTANAALVYAATAAATRRHRRPDLAGDFQNDAWVEACRAVGDYEAGRGASLTTWIVVKVKFACSRYACKSRRNREKRTRLFCDIGTIDRPRFDCPDPTGEAHRDQWEARADAASVLAAVLPSLTDRELTALRMVAAGHKTNVIAREIGFSTVHTLNILAAARAKCRWALTAANRPAKQAPQDSEPKGEFDAR